MKIIYNNNYYNVTKCNTFLKRLKGFMFKKNIDKILIFYPCNSVHTMFMKKNIDIIMTDKNFKILYLYNNTKPFKIILPKKDVYYVIESKVNLFKFNKNEKIKFND